MENIMRNTRRTTANFELTATSFDWIAHVEHPGDILRCCELTGITLEELTKDISRGESHLDSEIAAGVSTILVDRWIEMVIDRKDHKATLDCAACDLWDL